MANRHRRRQGKTNGENSVEVFECLKPFKLPWCDLAALDVALAGVTGWERWFRATEVP